MRRQSFLRDGNGAAAVAGGAGRPRLPDGAPIGEWDLPGRLTGAEVDRAAVLGGWSQKSRYGRRAEVEWAHRLTSTGTVRLGLRVIDDEPFDHDPGQFVGVEMHVEDLGYARSPYCILSPPTDDGRFELIVRVVRNGPVSRYLGSCEPGEVIAFRGPTGRSMVPHDDGRALVLMATGVGIGPLHALADHLLRHGFEQRITLFWGLRLADDIFLTDELDALARQYPNFSYRITLSSPPPAWTGLRGRITESVPPLLTALGGTRYYLVGNGAMTEEMATALSDMGAAEDHIYQEHYFNQKHVPDPFVLASIRARFVAADLFSPLAHQQALGSLFHLDTPLGGGRGNADPSAPTEVGRAVPKVVERARRRGEKAG